MRKYLVITILCLGSGAAVAESNLARALTAADCETYSPYSAIASCQQAVALQHIADALEKIAAQKEKK